MFETGALPYPPRALYRSYLRQRLLAACSRQRSGLAD
jgi:hypothetical protein